MASPDRRRRGRPASRRRAAGPRRRAGRERGQGTACGGARGARKVRIAARAYPEPLPNAADRPGCDGAHRTRVPARCVRAIDHRPPRTRTSLPWRGPLAVGYGAPVTAVTSPGATWGVGHGPETGDARSSRTPGATSRVGPADSGHESSNDGHPAGRPGRGGGGGLIDRWPPRRRIGPPRGSRGARRGRPAVPSGDPSALQVRCPRRGHHPRCIQEVGVPRDGPGEPAHVGRLQVCRSRRASGRGTSRRRSSWPALPRASAAAGDGCAGRGAAPGGRSGRTRAAARALPSGPGEGACPEDDAGIPRRAASSWRCGGGGGRSCRSGPSRAGFAAAAGGPTVARLRPRSRQRGHLRTAPRSSRAGIRDAAPQDCPCPGAPRTPR